MKEIREIIKENNLPDLEVGKIYNLFNDLWDGNGEFPLSNGSYSYQVDDTTWVNYTFSVSNFFPCGEEKDMQERCSYCQYADGHGVCQVARTHPESKEEWEVMITGIKLL